MIKDKNDLKEYLTADDKNYQFLKGYNIKKIINASPISDNSAIWEYIYTLRHCEYAINRNLKLRKIYYLWKLRKLSYKTGFQIPPNVIGKGVTLYHYGMIIINAEAKIGENCTIHPDVVIGKKEKNGAPPCIENDVYICSGARIIGNITIGHNTKIAPNTYVYKNTPPNCVISGNPACIVKKDGMKVNIKL